MSCQPLEFDTEQFGVKTGSIEAGNIDSAELLKVLEDAKAEGYQLLYWNLPTGDPHAGEILDEVYKGGYFVGGKVTYEMELSKSLVGALSRRPSDTGRRHSFAGEAAELQIREYESSEPCPALFALGGAASQSSAFHEDPNFSRTMVESLYHTLITNSTNHTMADVVLVAHLEQLDGQATVGMVSVSMKDGVGTIQLLAVDKTHRGKGVGKQLLVAAFDWILNQGGTKCSAFMQSQNAAARQLFESCGGLTASSAHIFHFWLASRPPFNDFANSTIPNNKPYLGGDELEILKNLFESRAIQTRGKYTKECETRLEKELQADKVLLVNSGTAALEMASLIIGSETGVEVIMPSFTFTSTANAFVIHGATPVFVDVRADTQNIDETKIEAAISERTRAICCVHYAGIPCEMDTIMAIAKKHNLLVVEDNAHGVFSAYKGKMLGTMGHLGALSFHYTKNIICGEGGALIVNDPELLRKAMVVLEKGTNRFDFLQGRVNKYAWCEKGGSFVMSEVASAILSAQLQIRPMLIDARVSIFNKYHAAFAGLEESGKLQRPVVPAECTYNGHIFYIRIKSKEHFDKLAVLSKQRKIGIFTHYEALHASAGGELFGRNSGSLDETVRCCEQLYRMPMWVGLTDDEIQKGVECVQEALA